MTWLNSYADPVYCLIRLIVGLMFACHGGQKILGFPPGGRGAPTIASLAGWIELAGGLLIAFGLHISWFTLPGKAIGHAPTASERFFPILNKGELPVLFCLVFFFIVFYGPGRWSVDALMKRGTARPRGTA